MIGGTVAVVPSSFGVCSGVLRAGVGGVGDWITCVFVGEGVAGGAVAAVLPSTAPRAGVGGCGDGAAVSTEATRVTGGSGDGGAGGAQAERRRSASAGRSVGRE